MAHQPVKSLSRAAAFLCLAFLILGWSSVLTGCGQSDSTAVNSSADQSIVSTENAQPDSAASSDGRVAMNDTAGDGQDASPSDFLAGGASLSELAEDPLQLTADAKPTELVMLLGKIDRRMRAIANGETSLSTSAAIQAELKRLAKLKLEASGRLLDPDSVPPELLKRGKQGKLQAYSHLLALGEIAFASELKRYAEELSESSDARLAVDSRLILISFAMEDLSATDNPEPVVELIEQLSRNAQVLDMPALMAVGQARSGLEQYGYDAAARRVRGLLVETFANHTDPNIRAMSESLARSERFDVLNGLRRDLEQGRLVTPGQWQQAATHLIRRGADLEALRYLSENALQFEVGGRQDLTETAYELIQAGFQDTDDASIRQEQEMVLSAYAARQKVIGQSLQVDLPDTAGVPVPWDSFRGQWVLMPIWAAEHPESITTFRQLEQIRDRFPKQVALVGVNVDLNEEALAAFENEIQLDWPTLRSPSAQQQGVQNPIARQTGITSFPFVVLVDQEGLVQQIFMTNQGIDEAVAKWVEPPN